MKGKKVGSQSSTTGTISVENTVGVIFKTYDEVTLGLKILTMAA
jgi:hypothetical protein